MSLFVLDMIVVSFFKSLVTNPYTIFKTVVFVYIGLTVIFPSKNEKEVIK